MRTPRLSVVDWTDAPDNLNGLVRFAERRNLVSTRAPSHFNWPLQRVRLRARRTAVRIPATARDYSLLQDIQIGWVPLGLLFSGYRALFPGVKRPGTTDIDHSPPSSAEVKNGWSYTSTPPICLHGMDRENFTLFSPHVWPWLRNHENAEAIRLLDNMGRVRRLQRKKPFELV